MKKLILSLVFIAFKLTYVLAQFTCSTTTNAPKNLAAQSTTITPLAVPQADGSYTVNIFFHIIRTSSGAGGINPSSLGPLVTLITNGYSPFNIKVVNAGYDFVNSDSYTNFNGSDASFNALIAVNNKPNAINIYLLNNNPANFGGKTDAIPGHSIVVENILATTQVVVHELGHALGLYHTFHGQEPGGCAELANETNCGTCGDYICDTPADPFNPSSGLAYPSNITCMYIGPAGYSPDVSNYMCYSAPSCLTRFSSGQGSRMLNSLLNAAVLQAVIVTVNGPDGLCPSAVYSLNNLMTGSTVTWSVLPSGIVGLTQSGNQVTATKLTQGTATLTATINGTTTCSKTISTIPDESISSSMSGACSGGYQTWYLSAAPNMNGATSWQWSIQQPTSGIFNIYSPTSQSTYISVKGGGQVLVSYIDACGETSRTEGTTIYSTCSGSHAIVAYPNPANTQITIASNSTAQDAANLALVSNATPSPATPFSAELFDDKGVILKTGQTTQGNPNVVFSTSDLSNGMYFIHVKIGSDLVEQQVLIKH